MSDLPRPARPGFPQRGSYPKKQNLVHEAMEE